MNRRERRAMAHNLGIMQYQQKLPLYKKFNLIRENIIAGKQAEKEMKEQVRQQTNEQDEKKESSMISHLAEDLMKQKNISIDDAILEAKNLYKKERKK